MLGLGRDRCRLIVANGLPWRRRLVHIAATLAQVSRLSAEFAVDVDKVGIYVRHCGAGNQAKLVPTLALVLKAVRIDNVAQYAHIFAELTFVLAVIIGQTIK